MIIYIDVIFFENIIMNYIIILTTGIICNRKINYLRIFYSSTIGAIYTILNYILKIKILNNFIIQLILAVIMMYISFKPKELKILFKIILKFFLTSFCFGGVSYYLLNIINTKNIYPIIIIILGGIIGATIITVSFKNIKGKLIKSDLIYNVIINYKDKRKKIKIILDTGNLLQEPITNVPVMIVEKIELIDVLPNEILNNIENIIINNESLNIDTELITRFSIIPYTSIGKNNGLIVGFRPDFIQIEIDEKNEIVDKCIVGIYNGILSKEKKYSGLMGLNLLNSARKCE